MSYLRTLRLRISRILMMIYNFERWAGLGAWHYGSGLLW